MESITKEKIQIAISEFFDTKSGLKAAREKFAKEGETFSREKSSEKREKQLAKVESTRREIEKCEEIRAVNYDSEIWIKNAAEKLTKQLKFGTHISKGIHPDSKGDNVNFYSKAALPEGLIGSQVLDKLELDANGNAAALPLVNFFNIQIDDNFSLRELILAESESLIGVFSIDSEKSKEYLSLFKHCLENKVSEPKSYELNKQLLWPVGETAIEDDAYTCLIPLYPSSFTHEFYKAVNSIFYSEENISARKSRFKKDKNTRPYVDQIGLGCLKLGGTKPQNISKLTSVQGGRNYLLPSLPPVFDKTRQYSVSKNQDSIFGRHLYFHCKEHFRKLLNVVNIPYGKNNVDIRDMRKEAMDLILHETITFAATIQHNWMPGWSKNEAYKKLNENEKFWLDPEREDLEGEEEFMEKRNSTDWVKSITERFAHWVNLILRKQFEKRKHEFDTAEYLEWIREFESAVKASLRAKEGIFV